MKKSFLLAISILGLMGPFGCGKMQTPTSPMAQSQTAVSSTASSVPSFSKAWSMAGSTALVNPQFIAADASGNLLVTDLYLNTVFKFDSNGNLLSQWGNRGDVTLDQPMGIAVRDGNIYVADSANARIVEYDANGALINQLNPNYADGSPVLDYPTCLSFDAQGNLYVCDNGRVLKFDGALQLAGQWGSEDSPDSMFNYPMGTAADSWGNLYVADFNADSIIKFNPAANTTQTWTTSGTQGGEFYGPSDVKLDAKGNVYVLDSFNNRVQVLTSAGAFVGQFGADANNSQALNGPTGMTFDNNGNLFVVDNGNARIVKYSAK